MGKRSGTLDHEATIMAGTLDELDRELARCTMMLSIQTRARNRKSLESRIHWLEQVRSRHPELKSN